MAELAFCRLGVPIPGLSPSMCKGHETHFGTLEEVKGVLGHTDIKTTQRYANLGATALRDAVRRTQLALTRPELVQSRSS